MREEELDAIREYVREMVAEWPPLTSAERDLVRRALAPVQAAQRPSEGQETGLVLGWVA